MAGEVEAGVWELGFGRGLALEQTSYSKNSGRCSAVELRHWSRLAMCGSGRPSPAKWREREQERGGISGGASMGYAASGSSVGRRETERGKATFIGPR